MGICISAGSGPAEGAMVAKAGCGRGKVMSRIALYKVGNFMNFLEDDREVCVWLRGQFGLCVSMALVVMAATW